MDLSEGEKQIAEEARQYMKHHVNEIVQFFVHDIASVEEPVSVFMAGSPGAGKTEFSKRLLEKLGGDVVRIDSDDIRNLFPQYNGRNSYIFNGPAALGVEKVYDYVLRKSLHVLLDGTLQNFEKAESNIERSLKNGRKVEIFYVFQDPLIAWDFTEKREAVEGRNIPKEAFVSSLFSSNQNIKMMKEKYAERIAIHIVLKNITNDNEEIHYNVKDVDKYVKIGYTQDELKNQL